MKTVTVCELTGATYRQLDHWTSKGYVSPSIEPTKGTGHCREWSTEDAVQVAIMVQLVRVGMDPANAAKYIKPGNNRAAHGAVTVHVAVQRIRELLTDRRDLVA